MCSGRIFHATQIFCTLASIRGLLTLTSMNNISADTTTESRYLQGIADNDFSILQTIYRESLPHVVRYIQKNSGTQDDAKDVFQEGILVVFRKIQKGQLELTSTFHAFLFGICKRIWLKKLKRMGRPITSLDEASTLTIEEDLAEDFVRTRKWQLFNRKFQSLSEECRNVLQFLFNGQSGKAIAESMGYTEEYAKRKKYKCKMQLAKLIKSDPEFKHLTA